MRVMFWGWRAAQRQEAEQKFAAVVAALQVLQVLVAFISVPSVLLGLVLQQEPVYYVCP